MELTTFYSRRFTPLLILLMLAALHDASSQMTFAPVTEFGRMAVNDMARIPGGELLVAGSGGLFIRGEIQETWEKVDFPYEIYSLMRLDDGSMLAGSVRGIQRSTDGGRTWRLVANVADVGDFAVNQSGVIMAAPWLERDNLTGFVYTSEDGGLTWTPFRTSFGTLSRNNVVALGDLFFTGSASGLKLTYNNGDVWETTRLIDSIGSLISTENGTLVATSGHEIRRDIIWESHDTGRSWTQVDSIPGIHTLHAGAGDEYFFTVTSTYGAPDEGGMGLWRREAGEEGRELLYGTDGIVDVLADGDAILIAENFRLREGSLAGGSWTEVTGDVMSVPPGELLTTPDGRIHVMIPDSLSFVYGVAQTGHALLSSDDNGETWTHQAASFTPQQVVGDEVGNVYVVDKRTEWRKDSTGRWRVWGDLFETYRLDSRDGSFDSFFAGNIRTIASHPSGIIAVTFRENPTGRPFGDIRFSLDSGATWKWFSDEGYPFAGFDSIPGTGAIVVATDGAIVANVYGDDLDGIYRFTLDPEGSTTTLSTDQLNPPSIIRMDDGRLLMTSYLTGDGLYRSSDNGITWEPVAAGQRMVSVQSLGDGTLFADNRFFSNDYGESWFGSEQLRRVVRGGDRILYAINGAATGFRKSTSNGTLWIDAGFREISGYGSDLEVTNDGYLFVATSEGLYRSVLPSSVPSIGSIRSAEGLWLDVQGDRVTLAGDALSPVGTTGRIYDIGGRFVAELRLQTTGSNEMSGNLSLTDLPKGTWLLVVRSGDSQASTLFIR